MNTNALAHGIYVCKIYSKICMYIHMYNKPTFVCHRTHNRFPLNSFLREIFLF